MKHLPLAYLEIRLNLPPAGSSTLEGSAGVDDVFAFVGEGSGSDLVAGDDDANALDLGAGDDTGYALGGNDLSRAVFPTMEHFG